MCYATGLSGNWFILQKYSGWVDSFYATVDNKLHNVITQSQRADISKAESNMNKVHLFDQHQHQAWFSGKLNVLLYNTQYWKWKFLSSCTKFPYRRKEAGTLNDQRFEKKNSVLTCPIEVIFRSRFPGCLVHQHCTRWSCRAGLKYDKHSFELLQNSDVHNLSLTGYSTFGDGVQNYFN